MLLLGSFMEECKAGIKVTYFIKVCSGSYNDRSCGCPYVMFP